MPSRSKLSFTFTSSLLVVLLAGEANASFPGANPYLAATHIAITHVDSAQTDSFPYTIPKGDFNVDLNKMPQVAGGPINIMTLASTSPNYMWGVSSGGVTYIDCSGDNWKEVARVEVPNVPVFSAEFNKKAMGQPFTSEAEVENVVKNIYKINGFERMINGIYSLADKDNVVYANFGKIVYAFSLKDPNNPKAGIKILRSKNFETISKNEKITGLSLTYDGNLVIVGNRSLTVIDREFKGKGSFVAFNKNEYVSNSVCVDENNAIYIASDKLMRKVVWTGKKLSTDEADGAWSSIYDTGEQPPVVKVGTGTGSTPTLMGFGMDPDKLVVITDGANRMKLVAFWRNDIPKHFVQLPGAKSKRIAGQIQVTCGFKKLPKFIQSEQSVVVKDYGAFVVNNIGVKGNKDILVGVMALGPVYPPAKGAERFTWDPISHKWSSAWSASDVVSTSMVPVISTPSNIVLVNGYTKEHGWEVTGLDWYNGKVVHRTIFGQNNYGNGAYALLEIYPDNNLIFNSITGPFRIQYSKL